MNTLYTLFYHAEGIAAVPGLLYELHQGDVSAAEQRLSDALEAIPDTPSVGQGSQIMGLEVLCSDFAPFIRPETAFQAAPTPFLNVGIFKNARLSLCDELSVAPPDPAGDQPVRSSIPTLVLAGGLDHVTPAIWGARSADTLSHSYFFTLADQSHVVSGSCVNSMTTQFLNDPAIAPDATCLANERPLQFLIVPAGTRPLVSAILALLAAGIAGVSVYSLMHTRRRPQLNWRYNLRIVGWTPMAFAALVIAVAVIAPDGGRGMEPFQKPRLIETIIPLAMAIQAALLFSPDDEAPLEILLACPRPIAWLVLERLLVVVLGQGAIALIGALAITALHSGDVVLALLRWIPPAALLTGLALNGSIHSRKSVFGVLSVGVIWFAFAIFGEAFLPGQFVFWPLNYIQPLLWPLHIFLQPGDLLGHDYLLNRLFVLIVGLNLIALAVVCVRDTEHLLVGKAALKRQS